MFALTLNLRIRRTAGYSSDPIWPMIYRPRQTFKHNMRYHATLGTGRRTSLFRDNSTTAALR